MTTQEGLPALATDAGTPMSDHIARFMECAANGWRIQAHRPDGLASSSFGADFGPALAEAFRRSAASAEPAVAWRWRWIELQEPGWNLSLYEPDHAKAKRDRRPTLSGGERGDGASASGDYPHADCDPRTLRQKSHRRHAQQGFGGRCRRGNYPRSRRSHRRPFARPCRGSGMADEAGYVEFVNVDVPFIVREIDGPVAILLDMETRNVIGYRVYDSAPAGEVGWRETFDEML
jgi:hypothetical protein